MHCVITMHINPRQTDRQMNIMAIVWQFVLWTHCVCFEDVDSLLWLITPTPNQWWICQFNLFFWLAVGGLTIYPGRVETPQLPDKSSSVFKSNTKRANCLSGSRENILDSLCSSQSIAELKTTTIGVPFRPFRSNPNWWPSALLIIQGQLSTTSDDH